MADNVELNLGVGGDNIAADDISGVKHQRVKIQIGADGEASDVEANNPLPSVLYTVTDGETPVATKVSSSNPLPNATYFDGTGVSHSQPLPVRLSYGVSSSPTSVEGGIAPLPTLDFQVLEALERIILELKINNLHLELLTGEHFTDEELEHGID